MQLPAQITAPTLRPGERMLHGKPYVFNADLLALHLACEAVAAAPARLSDLSDEALRSLRIQAGKVDDAERVNSSPLTRRIADEYAARGWDSGGAVNAVRVQAQKAA